MSGVLGLGRILENVAHESSDISDAPNAEFSERLGLESSSGSSNQSGATNIPARLGTPRPEIFDHYRDPASLPSHHEEDPRRGTRQYGSVEVYGGPPAWEAYEELRQQPTPQARKVIATIENLNDRYVEVHPYTVSQGTPSETYPRPDT